jgi:hypothetical protein
MYGRIKIKTRKRRRNNQRAASGGERRSSNRLEFKTSYSNSDTVIKRDNIEMLSNIKCGKICA